MDTKSVQLILLILAAVCFLLEGLAVQISMARKEGTSTLNLMCLGFFFLTVYLILGTGVLK